LRKSHPHKFRSHQQNEPIRRLSSRALCSSFFGSLRFASWLPAALGPIYCDARRLMTESARSQ
jgi:hypothetical protein